MSKIIAWLKTLPFERRKFLGAIVLVIAMPFSHTLIGAGIVESVAAMPEWATGVADAIAGVVLAFFLVERPTNKTPDPDTETTNEDHS